MSKPSGEGFELLPETEAEPSKVSHDAIDLELDLPKPTGGTAPAEPTPAASPAPAAASPTTDTYSVAPADAALREMGGGWYIAKPGGTQEGPFSIEILRQRADSGGMRPDWLVWRQGMHQWAAANTIPGLFDVPVSQHEPTPRGAPPSAPPRPMQSAPASSIAPGSVKSDMEEFTRLMSTPKFYRMFGRVCGVLGLVVILLALPLAFFGWSSFAGGVALIVAFLVGEGLATILEALSRIESRLGKGGPKEPSP
jgi:hypothetical protein